MTDCPSREALPASASLRAFLISTSGGGAGGEGGKEGGGGDINQDITKIRSDHLRSQVGTQMVDTNQWAQLALVCKLSPLDFFFVHKCDIF